jgi:hypothetical protein
MPQSVTLPRDSFVCSLISNRFSFHQLIIHVAFFADLDLDILEFSIIRYVFTDRGAARVYHIAK